MTIESREERLADALDDLLQRRRRGERVGSEAYRDRLGDDTPTLEGALRAAELLEAAADGLLGPPDPQPGDGVRWDGAHGEVARGETTRGGATSAEVPPGVVGAPTRYRLGRELGRGGAGVVYEAYDGVLARTVAWKTVRGDVRLDAAALERFRREARAAASLHHPHVVAIHDAGETDGRPWYAMELVRGGTLADALRVHALPPLPRLLRGLADLADGLHALHGVGMVHRDVKPSNVLVRDDGSFVLGDFGLARVVDADGPTMTGQVLGSPPYMSPEQAEGRHDAVDARTDVYALGATVFHAVTGAPPFAGDDPADVLRRVRTETPPRASSRVPGLPRGLDAVLVHALAKRPADRTPSAAALRDDLLAVAAGRRPPSLRARRTRRIAGAALALGALAAVLALGLPSRAQLHTTRLDTLPASDLELDGATVGRTPIVRELAPGAHRVLARRDGYEAATWTIAVPGPEAAPVVLTPAPGAAARGEVEIVEAALGHALGPWLEAPVPPPDPPSPPGTLHAVLPRGAVSRSDLAHLRIERTPATDAGASPLLGEIAFTRGEAVVATFPVALRSFPAEVAPPEALLAGIREGDEVRWTLRVDSGGGGGATASATFSVAADDPASVRVRAALATRLSAAPPAVRAVGLAAFDLESGRPCRAALSLLSTGESARSPLTNRLVGRSLHALGAGDCPSARAATSAPGPQPPK